MCGSHIDRLSASFPPRVLLETSANEQDLARFQSTPYPTAMDYTQVALTKLHQQHARPSPAKTARANLVNCLTISFNTDLQASAIAHKTEPQHVFHVCKR